MATVTPLHITNGLVSQINLDTGTVAVGTGLTIGDTHIGGKGGNLVFTAPPGSKVIIRGDLIVEGSCTTASPLLEWRNANLDPCNRH